MKKGNLVIILSLILILIPVLFCLTIINFQLKIKTAETLSAEIISGEASQSNLGMSISVVGSPFLSIIKPTNETFLVNNGIPLEFNSDGLNFWYNLDNEENITIDESTFFNVTSGSHTLNLFANNSRGVSSKSVSFIVNPTKIKVIMDQFNEELQESDESHSENLKKERKGETTDILDYSFEQIQNLSEFVLDEVENGKIKFYEPVNLTDNEDFSKGVINLTKGINISHNYIEIDSNAFPGLNKSATIYLYNLIFTNPRILRGGKICPETICEIIGYSNENLIFRVNQFSAYSIEETPKGEEKPQAVSPEGSSGSILQRLFPLPKFDLDEQNITIKLKQGETTTRYLKITNRENKKISLILEDSKMIDDLLKMSTENLTLNPNESKTVTLDFFAREATLPGLYLGKITLEPEGAKKEIEVLIEVVTKEPLFDMRINLPDKYQWVMPGEEIYYSVEIFNLGDAYDEVDIEVEYSLIDSEGNKVLTNHESMAVNTKLSYVKDTIIPESIELGKYIIYIQTKYHGEIASASTSLNIGPQTTKEFPMKQAIYLLPLFISIIAMIFMIMTLLLFLKHKKQKYHKTLKNIKQSKHSKSSHYSY